MTFDQIITDLNNKVYHPFYFLMGEEPYFIDEISNYILNTVLDETEQEFNQTVLYGRDVDVETIISEAKRFPMMANHQVLVIKEAQVIKNIEDLLPYIQNFLPSTILVICYKYKTLDKRKKVTKLFEKHGVLYESKKLYDNHVQAWITRHLREKGYKIEPGALVLLTEYLGSEISKIANELEKLIVNLEDQAVIDTGIIETNIGISKDYNRFELQKAIGNRNIVKANRVINYFESNPSNNPLVLTLSSLYVFFTKVMSYHFVKDKSKNNVAAHLQVHPYFVRDYEIAAKNYGIKKLQNIMSNLREVDLRSKGVDNSTATSGELLKELLYKILH